MLNISHTLWVWHPVIFMFLDLKKYLLGHCITCDEDAKRATIAWISQKGYIPSRMLQNLKLHMYPVVQIHCSFKYQ
jgi:hypothetical protein